MTKKYDDLNVIKQIVVLQNLNNAVLDKMWRKFFEGRPEIESRQYMIAKIAYRIQELAYGGVDTETEEKIKAAAKKVSMPHAPKKAKKFDPMIGTKIVKEYRGKVHEVLVINDGFSYYGETYKSLSAIATKITGTKWNGLKFFNVAK